MLGQAEVQRVKRATFVSNLVATALFFPALILLLAGDWRWIEGWILAVWLVVMILFNVTYLYWKDPALLAERTKRPGSGNQKPWDEVLMVLLLGIAALWLVVMPLDAARLHWSPAFPLWCKVLGGIALCPALYLIERTTMENTYLSTRVRIQSDRRQRVISTGPYAFVRHPLYLGCLLMMLGAPLLVGSLYGLLVSLLGFLLLVVRIVEEEAMLTDELEGYAEYRNTVKYRLLPAIW